MGDVMVTSEGTRRKQRPDGKAWSPSFTGTYTKVK